MFGMQNPYGDKLTRSNPCEVAMHKTWRMCHKATLKAMVKWLDEPCNDHLKGLGSPRRYCDGCLAELRKAAEE